jgi:hypothetical protein
MSSGTDDIEQRVRERFAAEALAAPPPPSGLASAAKAHAGAGRARRSRRAAGLLAAAAVAVLVAGSTAWVLAQDGDSTEVAVGDGRVPDRPGAVVPLPTSGWEPGDPALTALHTGVVAVDADGCVSAGLLWPAGFSARRDADGRVSILDSAGTVVLREGDRFEVGGGPGEPGRTCGPQAAAPFAMMSIPRRVP